MKRIHLMAAALLLSWLAAASAASVEPVLISDYQAGNAYFEIDTYADGCGTYALKVNQSQDGAYYGDGGNTITITNSDGTTFDWSSEFPVCAVIVKGGPSANVFLYDPPAYGDTVLYAPVNPENGRNYGVSHVTFGYGEGDGPPTGDEDPVLTVAKFYDANANGIWDSGELELEGWLVRITRDDGEPVFNGYDALYAYTPVEISLVAGDYTVEEMDPVETGWVNTTGKIVMVFDLEDGEEASVEFGNVCLGAGGGHTLGFWSNKNGQKLIEESDLGTLAGLNLVDADGDDFDPETKSELKTWLLDGKATNMAYMLSVQLAAMVLNLQEGFVDGDSLVYAPGCDEMSDFITVADLVWMANSALSADTQDRDYQECLKDALDGANNNENFVQAEPCEYTFE